MKKIILTFILSMVSFPIFSQNTQNTVCRPGDITTANAYQAIQWYRSSAERKALYREIFSLGEEQIRMKETTLNLPPQQWGVVFDIDETLLDNSQHSYENALKCESSNSHDLTAYFAREVSTALPGARHITCTIKSMGGYVSLVSNRIGNDKDPATGKNLLEATLGNLNKQGICYDQVVLANPGNMDKNDRFKAVITGNYPDDMIVSKKLPAHTVLAFFGDNIQDFPNKFQQHMRNQNGDASDYNSFGASFFALPNPLYGSWQE